jgi:DNA topoisomerase-1
MDYGFTARIEEEFDEIANGKMKWNNMIGDFYQPFHSTIEHTLENAERAKGARELGVDAATGKKVTARMGRFGAMVQIGDAEDEEKPRFASLKPNQSIETITFEEAMQLFELPKVIGEYQGQELSVNIGRFGPYIKFGEQFVSIPKNEDLYSISAEQAIQLINQKQQADAPIGYYNDLPVTKGKGRFGPFIKWNSIYINVSKKYNFDNLSEDDIKTLIETKIEKEANRYIQQWADEKISIENGRWGAFIRYQKNMLKMGRKPDGAKYNEEELKTISLEEVKKMIEEQMPNAFAKKGKKKK